MRDALIDRLLDVLPYLADDTELVIADALRAAYAAGERAGSTERHRRASELWGRGGREGMTLLCRAFPSLATATGVDPWDPIEFLHWLCSDPAVTSGSANAGRFVLSIWNSRIDWAKTAREQGSTRRARRGERPFPAPFNVIEALAAWDETHRRVFLSFCEAPFFP